LGQASFETINAVGEDRLVRATIPLTVQATLLSEQEARMSTVKKMYSIKKVVFETAIDVGMNIFSTTIVPVQLLRMQSVITSGGNIMVSGGGTTSTIDGATMSYLTNVTDKIATYVSATTITISGAAAINPVTTNSATANEFDVYVNGQYIDKIVYTWTPTIMTTQTIIFDTATLGYSITPIDTVVVKGRWA
jgi:hypothetical protein